MEDKKFSPIDVVLIVGICVVVCLFFLLIVYLGVQYRYLKDDVTNLQQLLEWLIKLNHLDIL